MQMAQDIMTRRPATCYPRDSIYDAVRVMNREDCGVVPIVDEESHCVGIVTDRDICLRTVLDHLDPMQTMLSEIMSDDVVSVAADEPITDVLDKMAHARVRRLPVLDPTGCLMGIISESDIAKSEWRNHLGNLLNLILQED